MSGRNSDLQPQCRMPPDYDHALYRLRGKDQDLNPSTSLQPVSATWRFSYQTSSKTHVLSDQPTNPTHQKALDLVRIKMSIAYISAFNAVFSAVALAVGIWTVKEREYQEWETLAILRTVLGLISVIQGALVIGSWRLRLRLQEATRVVLGFNSTPIPQLFQSPKHICICSFESLFHILPLSLYPETQVSNQNLVYCLFLQMLFLRNYHAIQWAYWVCDYSGYRSAFYRQLLKTGTSTVLAGKASLKQHGSCSLC